MIEEPTTVFLLYNNYSSYEYFMWKQIRQNIELTLNAEFLILVSLERNAFSKAIPATGAYSICSLLYST
jgi:hypothetical protein